MRNSLPPVTLDDVVRGADVVSEPILIADGIWWVGHYLEGDPFQCHVYLLDRGDQSVLFDPGSTLTFAHTLRKVEQILPLSDIRYFVCHHQDPDITGALPLIDSLITRDDACVVTHWRAAKLLRHLGLERLPFHLVDENGWRLDVNGRELEFAFTPYAHFPGAFVTHDPQTGVVFTSDLFGGFTDGFSLLARDEDYFESLRPFHEHYMPSRAVLRNAMDAIERLRPRMLLPQHGSIIPEHLVGYMCSRLRELECGLYLMTDTGGEVRQLMRLSEMLRDLTSSLVTERDFKSVVARLRSLAAELLPVEEIEFWVVDEADERALHLGPETRYRGVFEPLPDQVARMLDTWSQTDAPDAAITVSALEFGTGLSEPGIILPLRPAGAGAGRAVAVFHLSGPASIDPAVRELLDRMGATMEVLVEREALHQSIELERQRLYERSIRDALTGLYTRRHLREVYPQWGSADDRDTHRSFSLLMVDIDHFKSVNDTWGHGVGDRVLVRVAEVMSTTLRSNDIVFRLGGEEFAALVDGADEDHARRVADRVREAVASIVWEAPMEERRITLSVGVAERLPRESLDELLARADGALYRAKRTGRDRVVAASEVRSMSSGGEPNV